MKSELDFFRKVQFQGSIENSHIIEFRPVTALIDAQQIEFSIDVGPGKFLDMQNMFMAMKGKCVKQDGTDYVAADDNRFSLINYSLNTMFDQVDISLNGTLISQSTNTYHYQSYMECISEYDSSSLETYLRSSGFYQPLTDDAYDFDAIDAKLHRIVNQSKIFTLYGRPHGSIFNSDKLLISGVTMKLTFYRARPQFYGMGMVARAAVSGGLGAAAATQPKVNITDFSIFARVVTPSTELFNKVAKYLNQSKCIYPIKRPIVKLINLAAGQSTFILDNVFMGQMPCKLILGLVSHDAFSGSYQLNPLAFKNFGLKYLSVHINEQTFPKKAYEPDYANNNYEREYFDFFLNQGRTLSHSPPSIDFLNFKRGLCLYSFNFNSDFENPKENEYINLAKDGFLNIELKFAANLANALKVVCLGIFDNEIQIDINRNITLDY